MFKWVKKAKKLFSGLSSERSLVHIDDDGFMSDDINVSIEDIISDEENDDIGKLHVLSLTEFHQALGDMWDAREDKIFLLTEAVLRDSVGQGNRWEHQSKEIYIMIFPTLSEMDADARAFDIAEELGLKIIGERFDGSRRPFVKVAGVDPKNALNEDGTLNIDKLEQVGRAGKSAGNEEAIDPGSDTNAPSEEGPNWNKRAHEHEEAKTDWKNNSNAHQDKEGNWHKVDHESTEANTNWNEQNHDHAETNTKWKEKHNERAVRSDPNWKENEQKDKKDDAGPSWVSMDEKKEQPISKSVAKPAKPKPKYSLSFAPCWDKDTESLHIYKALLNYNSPKGQSLEGAKAYAGHKSIEQRSKIDLWVMQNTAKSLLPLVSKKIRTPVFVPFHSSSLRGEMRETFFENFGKFTHELRKNYFIIEIIDDGQWDQSDLEDLSGRLNTLAHSVAFQPNPAHDFKAPLTSNISWVGVDLSTLNEETGISPERLVALNKETAEIKAKFYLFGLTQREQVSDMLDLGASLISGNALVRTAKKLRPPFKLPIDRLKCSGSNSI